MSDLTIPNEFTSGTPAVAADVNENFDAVEAFAELAATDIRAHTWAFSGAVSTADVLPVMYVPVPAGRTAKLLSVRYSCTAGTGTFKMQVNGVDATGFTALSLSSTATSTDPADVTLANNDALGPVLTAASSLTNLSITAYVEYGIA